MQIMETLQSANFEQLRKKLPQCANMGAYAEQYVFSDPESALVKMRNLAEVLVNQVYIKLRLPKPFKTTFNDLLINESFINVVQEAIVLEKLHAIRKKGNEAAHGKHLSAQTALRMLKLGGRAAVVVPDGVLFGSSKAHQKLRETLIEQNQLEGVVSLPSGVFKPYAGVSTAILFFTKGGTTEKVWFYNLEADGYSLDDKRTKIDTDDLPDCLEQWQNYQACLKSGDDNAIEQAFSNKTQKAFLVDKADIASNKYDLSINRYKEIKYEEEEFEAPAEILKQLKSLEADIMTELCELEGIINA